MAISEGTGGFIEKRPWPKTERGIIPEVDPKKSVWEIQQIFRDLKVKSVAVIEGGIFKGLFTLTGLNENVILMGRNPKKTSVSEVMTPANEVKHITPFTSPEDCLIHMIELGVSTMPVLEKGEYVGTVSMANVVNKLINKGFDSAREFFNAYQLGGRT